MTEDEIFVHHIFTYILKILCVTDLQLKIIKRRGIKTGRSYVAGYINLQKKLVALDIYTPKTMRLKSINTLSRVIVHEIAHYQKQPYRQRFKGHIITRKHFPIFYRQIERNINKLKKDKILGKYFK